MKVLIGLLICLLMGSCSIWSRTTKVSSKDQQKKNVSVELQENLVNNTDVVAKSWFTAQDTSILDFKMQYYPKGNIMLSADGNLAGEFDSIVLVGKQHKALLSRALSSTQQTATATYDKVLKSDSTTVNRIDKMQKQQKPDVFFVVAGLLAVLFIGFLIQKKL